MIPWDDVQRILSRSPVMAGVLMVAGILLIGLVDLATGVELRVYPLYFLPLSLGAWFLGRRGALVGTLLATAAWYLFNLAAGMTYARQYVLYGNVLAQGTAFLTVSMLIARMRELLEHERQVSRTDPLTGLWNSRSFYERSEQVAALCRRNGRPITVAYVDLDNFKSVNDRLGHSRGDAVLRGVAEAIRSALRASDLSARIGGDEFVICLPETSETQAMTVLERVRANLRGPLDVPECQLSASIGAVSWVAAPERLDAMVHCADQLMYEIKREGKNRVRVVTRASGSDER